MSDDVATVLAEAVRRADREPMTPGQPGDGPRLQTVDDVADVCLAVLTAAGYAVVKVPEGVAVAHGAMLVRGKLLDVSGRWDAVPLYAIEATP